MRYADHFLRLLQLIKKEREEDRKQYEQKIANRSLDDRKKEGVTWHPVVPYHSFLGTGEKWVIKVERTTDIDKRHMFQVGSTASIFLNQEKSTLAVSGIISQVNEKYMTLVLHKDEPPEWLYEGKLGVNLLFDESTYDEMERTMVHLSKTDDDHLLSLVNILVGDTKPRFAAAHPFESAGLNESQNQALSLVNSAQDVALVHGPPGTGKTTTLVEAITHVLKDEKQVLVTAASNAAVDLLVEKLTHKGLRVLRLGHPARVTEEVVATTLDYRLGVHNDAKLLKDLRKKAEEMRAMGGKYKRNFGKAERQQRKLLYNEARELREEAKQLEGHMIFDELNKAEVIACTLVGANNSYLVNRRFRTLFIDEASQAMEPANWIPIQKAQRLVMAGDHWQLPPTIKSIEVARSGLSETIFERMMKRGGNDVMLQTQYRMHDDIMSFSNHHFYNGALRSGDSIERRRSLFPKAVRFIDTAGCGFDEKLNSETLSTYNEEEARFVLARLDDLIGKEDETRARLTFGVIAPYRAQTALLNKYISEYDWFKEKSGQITVNSIDAFQGQERDVIIMSLVRSNANGEIGFLADERRMNVAMTRARHLFMVVGDSATISSHSFFDSLIAHYQQRDWYQSAFEFLYS